MREVLIQVGIDVRLQDVLEHRQLRFFLRAERLGIVEHFAVAVAEDVRRIPAFEAEQPGLESRREDRLHQRLAGLEILAADRRARLYRQVTQCRNVDRQVRSAVRESDTALHRRVGVEHRRRDGLVVLLHRGFKRFDGPVRRLVDLLEDLCRRRPDHNEPVAAVLGLEVLDVGDERLRKLELVRAGLHVGAVQALDVVLAEDRLHRLDRAQEVLDLVEQLLLEHASVKRGFVGVFLEDVPRPELDVVDASEGNELVDLRRSAVGALAEADSAHLGERADRLGEPATHGFDAGDDGGADGSEADEKDAKLALGVRDLNSALVRHVDVSFEYLFRGVESIADGVRRILRRFRGILRCWEGAEKLAQRRKGAKVAERCRSPHVSVLVQPLRLCAFARALHVFPRCYDVSGRRTSGLSTTT